MTYSEAMKRAIKKYEQEKVERILIRVPKGKKEVIQEFATERGMSLNALFIQAVDKLMAEENNK